MRHLTVLEDDKSKEDMLETHVMAITDESAVKTTIWNLTSKVAKHIAIVNVGDFLDFRLRQ